MITLEEALQERDLTKLMTVPKSDIHTHGGKGGRIKYYAEWAKADIKASQRPFEDLDDMQRWFEANIKAHDKGIRGYLKRVEAAFAQARADNITVLALSYSLEVIDSLGGIDSFIKVLNYYNDTFAPETRYYPEFSFLRNEDIDIIYNRMDEILSKKWFKSIDMCGDELSRHVGDFKRIYRKAQGYGVRLKAHVGEFGTAEDVREAVETLELSEVHHGIAAAESKDVMKWLARHKIQLNVCPASNIMLKRAPSYQEHPIKELYENGIPVTINTDDLLIFDSSVSEEYMKLYENGVFSVEDLEIIRQTGLKAYE